MVLSAKEHKVLEAARSALMREWSLGSLTAAGLEAWIGIDIRLCHHHKHKRGGKHAKQVKGKRGPGRKVLT